MDGNVKFEGSCPLQKLSPRLNVFIEKNQQSARAAHVHHTSPSRLGGGKGALHELELFFFYKPT